MAATSCLSCGSMICSSSSPFCTKVPILLSSSPKTVPPVGAATRSASRSASKLLRFRSSSSICSSITCDPALSPPTSALLFLSTAMAICVSRSVNSASSSSLTSTRRSCPGSTSSPLSIKIRSINPEVSARTDSCSSKRTTAGPLKFSR